MQPAHSGVDPYFSNVCLEWPQRALAPLGVTVVVYVHFLFLAGLFERGIIVRCPGRTLQ